MTVKEMTDPDVPVWLTLAEVAPLARVTIRTLRQPTWLKRLNTRKIGGKHLVSRQHLRHVGLLPS